MLNEMDVKWCIVGHSERGHNFPKQMPLFDRKCILLQNGIQPIMCVGESLEEREAGKHEEVVVEQLKNGLSGLAADDQLRCTIAYEPVWAIGTGKTATPEQANSMHLVIRNQLAELATEQFATKMRILYGGSVNADNAEELLGQSEIDGALVGGASLKTDQFPGIIMPRRDNRLNQNVYTTADHSHHCLFADHFFRPASGWKRAELGAAFGSVGQANSVRGKMTESAK